MEKPKKKLDPALRIALKDLETRKRDLPNADATSSPIEQQDEFISILFKFQNDIQPLIALGLQVNSIIGNIGTGRIAINALDTLYEHPNIIKIEASRPLHRELDLSIPNVRGNQVRTLLGNQSGWTSESFTGRGVVVGIIDDGIDVENRCFNILGTHKSRILYLWDQSLTATDTEGTANNEHAPGELIPTVLNLNYGTEYDKAWIDSYLEARFNNTTPTKKVRQLPPSDDDHGTHVSGIAVGNGSEENTTGCCAGKFKYIGVAPEADIIFVKLNNTNDRLGESSELIDAINYITFRANQATKSCVINISQGDNMGSHDGTNLAEQAIDIKLGVPKVAIVKSAGNEGNKDRHAMGTVPAASNLDLKITVQDDDDTTRHIIIWYSGTHSLKCAVICNAEASTGDVDVGDDTGFLTTNNTRIQIASADNDPDNGDKEIYIKLRRPVAGGNMQSGEWTIRLKNAGALPVDFHAWIQRGNNTPVFATHLSNRTTLSIPGTSEKVITVGNYTTRGDGLGDLADSSSRGPIRPRTLNPLASVRKPEISAPGKTIMSVKLNTSDKIWAQNCCCCGDDKYQTKQGTSMAAPHVAGMIALMFQKNPNLTNDQIRSIITANVQSDVAHTGAVPNDDWGFGKIDIKAVMDAVPASASPAPPVVIPFAANNTPPPNNPPPQYASIWDMLQERFLALPKGQHLAAVWYDHFIEIKELINTNKKVATVWHRSNGTAWLRQFFSWINMPYTLLPETINDISLSKAVTNLTIILKRFGSPNLIHDLEAYAFELQMVRGGVNALDLANILIEEPIEA